MLTFDETDIILHTEMLEAAFKKGSGAPLPFDKFLKKTLPSIYKNVTYPQVIKIAKPLKDILRGDLEPAQVITLNEPILWNNDFPIWQGQALDGINLRGLGYLNGDSRYPSEVMLGGTKAHGIFGGATGQGKSVVMNSIVKGSMIEYPPWEVKHNMFDAKIAEFAPYAAGNVAPHINTIGATGDIDYIISALESIYAEMQLANKAFAPYGKSYKSFRKNTGLAIPRVFIPMDEVQTLIITGGRKAARIIELIDLIARLGRSTGYHLLLASQEPDAIPSNTLANITVRGSLGAQPNISEKLINNDEGKVYLGTPGRIIMNTDTANADKADNQHFYVPFIDDVDFVPIQSVLKAATDIVNFRHPFSFYDENAFKEEDQYQEFVKYKRSLKSNDDTTVYLGEPSKVMKSSDGLPVATMDINLRDMENILVHTLSSRNNLRYSKMLKYNFEEMSNVDNFYLTGDPDLANDLGVNAISIRDSGQGDAMLLSVFIKNLLLTADKDVFIKPLYNDESDRIANEVAEALGITVSSAMRSRVFYLTKLLRSKEFEIFGSAGLQGEAQLTSITATIKNFYPYYSKFNSETTQLTKSSFRVTCIWVLGIQRIIGWGRDGRSNTIALLKKAMMDANLVNTLFIINTTTMESPLDELKKIFRFRIMDGLSEQQGRAAGCTDYPETLAPVLGVLHDSLGEPPLPIKFKKMAFMGEMLGGE